MQLFNNVFICLIAIMLFEGKMLNTYENNGTM